MSEDTDHQAVAVREATVMPAGAPPPALAAMAISVQDVVKQAHLIQQVMRDVMRDNEHYGVIPGTSGKKSLLKSGAEKLCFTFGLAPRLDIRVEHLQGGHREYTIVCDLYDRAGNHRGQGVGSASTMESKHRYRGAAGKACPKCGAMSAKPAKAQYGGGFYCDKKSGGCGATFRNGTPEAKKLDSMPAVRTENPDPADQWNTVLKMAKKRALVDATLTATAASDIFAQDLDDLEGRLGPEEAAAQPATPQPATPQAARTGGQEPRQRAKRTAPAPQGQDSVTAPKDSSAPPAVRPDDPPAVAAAKALYERVAKASGAQVARNIIERLAKMRGADLPSQLHEQQVPLFVSDAEEMQKCTTVDDMLGQLQDWEAELAAMGGDA